RPFALQRYQASEVEVGVADQVPAPTVSGWPTTALPVIAGCAVSVSAVPAAATGPTSAVAAVVVPVVSVARTFSASACPTSFATTVYDAPVAPWIDEQCPPAPSQRNQL